MEPNQDYALTFDSETTPAISKAARTIGININRWNTNQTDIYISLEFSTTVFGYLTDTTLEMMQYMLTSHDISTYSAMRITESSSSYTFKTVTSLSNYEGTNVHIILYLTDFNPHSIRRLDVDIATTNLKAAKRNPSQTEEHEMCIICMNKVERGQIVNVLHCNHIYHHHCILDWIQMNIRCPTCRDTVT